MQWEAVWTAHQLAGPNAILPLSRFANDLFNQPDQNLALDRATAEQLAPSLLPTQLADAADLDAANVDAAADRTDTTNLADLSEATNLADLSEATNLANLSEATNLANLSEATNLANLSEATNLANLSEATNLADLSEATNLADLSEATNLADLAETTNLADLSEATNLTDLSEATNLAADLDAAKLANLAANLNPTDLNPTDLHAARRCAGGAVQEEQQVGHGIDLHDLLYEAIYVGDFDGIAADDVSRLGRRQRNLREQLPKNRSQSHILELQFFVAKWHSLDIHHFFVREGAVVDIEGQVVAIRQVIERIP